MCRVLDIASPKGGVIRTNCYTMYTVDTTAVKKCLDIDKAWMLLLVNQIM